MGLPIMKVEGGEDQYTNLLVVAHPGGRT